MNGTGLSTGFFFFIGACLLITGKNSDSEIYRKQRNLVNKIKKQSIRNYFIERCAGGPKSKHFWPTI
jgi:hypothetical protein